MSKSVTMGDSDEEDDWNVESGEGDGDGEGCEDEVEEVIQSMKTPKESVEQRMGGRINCGTSRS